MFVEETLFLVSLTPFRDDATATTYDSCEAVGREHDVFEAYATVDCEIIDTLFALLNEYVAVNFPSEIFGFAIDLFHSLIDRHSADRNRAIA